MIPTGKRTFVCMSCRTVSRRSIYSGKPVVCCKCHKKMVGISKKAEIPKKKDTKAWDRFVKNQILLHRWEMINRKKDVDS